MELSEVGKTEYQETKRIIKQAMSNDQLVLFVGAGASVDSGMPLWKSAIDKIAEKMPLIEDQKDPLKIPQYYFNSRGKKEYTELVRDIFKYEDNLVPTKLHKKILDFQTSTIVINKLGYEEVIHHCIFIVDNNGCNRRGCTKPFKEVWRCSEEGDTEGGQERGEQGRKLCRRQSGT